MRLLLNAAFGFLLLTPSLCATVGPGGEIPRNEDGDRGISPESDGPNDRVETPVAHDEVTVTATRTPTELRKVGQVVTLINREEIEARGARTVAQLLETVAGVSVSRIGSYGGATSVFVRGGESDFNLVMIDGVKVNQPGGTFDFADLSTANVERVEIVRGPSSVLYGASAASSVINVVTRKGEGLPTGLFRAEGGSYGSFGFDGAVGGGSERVEYSLGARADRSDGLYELNSAYRNADLSARTAFHLTPGTVLTGVVRFTDSFLQLPSDFTGAVVDPNDFRRNESVAYSASVRNRFSEAYEANLQYGYSRGKFQTFDVRDDVVDFFDSTFEVLFHRHQLDWQNDVSLNNSNLLTAGLAFEGEESETGNLDRRSIGIYLQDQFSWRDRLFLTAGFRYDDNNRFDNFTTGTLSVGWLLSQSMKIRGSLGNGVRAPAFFEIFGFPDFGIQGNPGLRPEKNSAVDFGFDYTAAAQSFSISGTGYFNRFNDLIEFTFLADPGSFNYFNVEAARSRGLELEVSATARGGLLLGGQYSLTDTKVTDSGHVPGGSFEEGRRLLRRPRNMAAVFAELDWRRTRIRLDTRWKGRRDDVQFSPDFTSIRVVLPSYWKVDCSLKVPLLTKSDSHSEWALILRAENLLDRHYTEIAGFESVGRSILGGLQFGF